MESIRQMERISSIGKIINGRDVKKIKERTLLRIIKERKRSRI